MQDAETFDRLWRGAQPLIRRTIARTGRGLSAEDREDAEAGARLRAWRSFPSFDPAQSFGAWVCTVARSEALDVCRKAGRGTVARTVALSESARDALFENVADRSPSALDGILLSELAQEIDSAARGLTLRQGRALRLTVGGMTCREAAAAMGASAQNVARAAQEARAHMARAFAAA